MINADQVEYWNEVTGPKWVEQQETLDALVGPAGSLALERAKVQTGERVLDVGCGCGATSLELARRVGARGAVVGLDISRPMLARARERADAASLSWITLRKGDAQVEKLEQHFDLVFSRFGVMFFEHPEAAFANLREHTRAGGRITFCCWRPLGENPWMLLPLRAVEEVLGRRAEVPVEGPGPFALADGQRIRSILAAAGWSDIECEAQSLEIPMAPGAPVRRAAEMSARLGPSARLLADADEADTRSAIDAIAAALQGYETPTGVVMPGQAWVVHASNAGG